MNLIFKKRRLANFLYYLPVVMALMLADQLVAQVNVLGKPGYVMTPNGRWEGKPGFSSSFSFVPESYAINYFIGSYHTENIYGFGVGLTDFMEVYFNVTRITERIGDIGIGDRHLGFRFLLFAEENYGFNSVLIVSAPLGTNQFLNHDALIFEKTVELSNTLGLRVTAGYALPFVIAIPLGKADSRSLSIVLKAKKEENIRYLSGVFGGISLDWKEKVGLSLEHDGRTLNAGIFVRPLPWIYVQGHTFEAKELGFSFSLRFPLSVAPKEMRADE